MISNILKAIPFARLQNLLSILDTIIQNGYTEEDLRIYILRKRNAIAQRERIKLALLRNCPKCGKRMQLYPVNTNSGDQTGDDSTFVWICPACRHEEWTNKPLRKIIHDLHGGRAPKMVSVNTADPPQVVNEGCKPKPPAHCRRVRRPGRRRRKR